MTCTACQHAITLELAPEVYDGKLVTPVRYWCGHENVDPLRNEVESDGNQPGPEIDDPYDPPAWCPLRPFGLFTAYETEEYQWQRTC